MANKLLAMAGFLLFALSPSFIDWEQSPERRSQFILYYLFAGILVYAGLDGWRG
jgi:hypothetical protein